jgi:hypothetical protein
MGNDPTTTLQTPQTAPRTTCKAVEPLRYHTMHRIVMVFGKGFFCLFVFWVFFFFFFGNKCFIKQSFKNYNAILKVVTWIKGIKVQLDKGYLSGLILNMDTQYK